MLSIFDNGKSLFEGPECIGVLLSKSDVSNSYGFGPELYFGPRICAAGFIFKWMGILISAIGIFSIIIPNINKKGIRIIVILFAIASLILSLPLYHKHSGLENSHRHSFWSGGLHLH